MSDTIQKYKDYVITSFVKSVQPVVVDRASGATITDVNGREYIDCFAGISVTNAGHGNSAVIEAAKAQMEKLVHCGSYIYYSQPTADLAERLAQVMPGAGLRKSFFGNGGAEAIEGALKLAKLYTGRHEVISLQASFHGRTWGALSVTGNSGRKRRGGPYASGITFAPSPYVYRGQWKSEDDCAADCAQKLRDIIRFETAGDVAAFIAEPVQGEGGIIVPPPNYFKYIKEVLDEYKILFICDEVQTGFARTGKIFAIEYYGAVPDILVTAKGIADGFPLSAFTTRDEVAAAFQPGDHLSTFGGNPVSCAAAIANIDFLVGHEIPNKSAAQGAYVMARLRELQKQFPIIGDVRGLGLMVGIELVRGAEKIPAAREAESIREYCLNNGILVGVGGVYGNVLRIQPPLVITTAQLNVVISTLEAGFRATQQSSAAA